MPNRHGTAIGAIVLVLALAPTGASAQGASAPPTTPSASGDATVPTGPVTTVGAIEYEYTDLPASVPAGTSLNLRNDGKELHMMIVARKNDGVTESWEELLAMSPEESDTKATVLGTVIAAPGETSQDVVPLDAEGDYFMVCFVPQGVTELPGPDASFPPDVVTHAALGMTRQFTVTAPGSTAGPLPTSAAG